jgi:hypothetical protein
MVSKFGWGLLLLFSPIYFRRHNAERCRWANPVCVLTIFLIVSVCLSEERDIFWEGKVTNIIGRQRPSGNMYKNDRILVLTAVDGLVRLFQMKKIGLLRTFGRSSQTLSDTPIQASQCPVQWACVQSLHGTKALLIKLDSEGNCWFRKIPREHSLFKKKDLI